MSQNWYPVINYDNCIECGACFEKCSHGVYKLEATKPIVVFGDGCIEGCTGCQSLCPAEAIEYVGDNKEDKDNKAEGCGCGGECC